MDTAPSARPRPLEHDLTTDVRVLGVGIRGLTAACLLLQAGRKAVIDQAPIGSGPGDLALLESVRSGDEAALAKLYDRHTPLLYPVALRILRSPADAEDAVQDAWLQVWKRSATYDPRRGAVVAWLLTVVRTRALDRWRSLSSQSRAESGIDPEPVNAPLDPVADTVAGQIGARVRDAMAALSQQQRQVLEIAYFEGLSQSEVAERLGAPLGTVKSWTRQGLLKLKELLPQEEWA